MIHFELDFEKCRRSKGINCRNCVDLCVMHILSIKDNKVTLAKPEMCIFCLDCQGACMVDATTIKIWDDENASITPVEVTTKKRE